MSAASKIRHRSWLKSCFNLPDIHLSSQCVLKNVFFPQDASGILAPKFGEDQLSKSYKLQEFQKLDSHRFWELHSFKLTN